MSMPLKETRTCVQCTLTFMVNNDVQNTEGDYEKVKAFVSQLVYSHWEHEEELYDTDQMNHEEDCILNPLWDYYFKYLHDGYNVD